MFFNIMRFFCGVFNLKITTYLEILTLFTLSILNILCMLKSDTIFKEIHYSPLLLYSVCKNLEINIT